MGKTLGWGMGEQETAVRMLCFSHLTDTRKAFGGIGNRFW